MCIEHHVRNPNVDDSAICMRVKYGWEFDSVPKVPIMGILKVKTRQILIQKMAWL